MNITEQVDTWAHPGSWSPLALTMMRIVGILIVAWIARMAAMRLIITFRKRIAARMQDSERIRRAETLGRVIRYLTSVVVALITGTLILSELGISVAPILGAAGVVGLAIGFGAQSLVKDYFTGFFLLMENQFAKGDIVQIADKAGLVEDVTLRYAQLRDYDGNVHFVPNNLITTVTNMSRGFAFAVMDIGVAYREDIDEALSVMRETATSMRSDAAFDGRILDDFEIAGVERWDDSAIVLRGRFKVAPLQQWDVRREYLRRLKRAFDDQGIEIPYPHLTVYAGSPKSGPPPSFLLRHADNAT